jgi:HAD superfamily hydrolase (TIGR01509 family)
MHFDTVLVEFEGVLVATAPARRAALQRALADDGLTLSDAEFDRRCLGFPPREAVLAATGLRKVKFDETAIDLAALRAERYFAEDIAKGVSLAPGAREFVADAATHAPLGIVTRASRREVDFVLGLAGLEASFDVIVTRDDVRTGKPSPEGYERALQKLVQRRRPSRPTTSVALEDAPPGVLAARAVKIPVIAVGSMPTTHAGDADAHVPSLVGVTYDAVGDLLSRAVTR